jgi:hypothetical protein
MADTQIPVSALRPVVIQFEDDFYQLAVWLLKHDVHNSTRTTTLRHTVHGVATAYEYLTRVSREEVLARVRRLQLPTGAIVELD